MAIDFNEVSFIYQANSPLASSGIENVTMHIAEGSFTAIVGHTGSGKSTLIQHLNALLKPTSGTVIIDDMTLSSQTKEKNLKALRQKVGVVFQFPEAQLFEETVIKDVMFGPLNFGMSEKDAEQAAKEALKSVGIDEEMYQKSPFNLSGGQMRRVAIAGILAIQPRVLVLDEPTAGLDPAGQREMMRLFQQLNQEHALTIILVTHQMDDVARYADDVLVMEKGVLIKQSSPKEIFKSDAWTRDHQIGVPTVTQMANRLKKKGIAIEETITTVEEMVAFIMEKIGETHVG